MEVTWRNQGRRLSGLAAACRSEMARRVASTAVRQAKQVVRKARFWVMLVGREEVACSQTPAPPGGGHPVEAEAVQARLAAADRVLRRSRQRASQAMAQVDQVHRRLGASIRILGSGGAMDDNNLRDETALANEQLQELKERAERLRERAAQARERADQPAPADPRRAVQARQQEVETLEQAIATHEQAAELQQRHGRQDRAAEARERADHDRDLLAQARAELAGDQVEAEQEPRS
jgi:hypothetical protein